jgi:hypothetical protein
MHETLTKKTLRNSFNFLLKVLHDEGPFDTKGKFSIS